MNNMNPVNNLPTLNSTRSNSHHSNQLIDEETPFSQLLHSGLDNVIEADDLGQHGFMGNNGVKDCLEDNPLISEITQIETLDDLVLSEQDDSNISDEEQQMPLSMLAATGFIMPVDVNIDVDNVDRDINIHVTDEEQDDRSKPEAILIDQEDETPLDQMSSQRTETTTLPDKKHNLLSNVNQDEPLDNNSEESTNNTLLKTARNSSTIAVDNQANHPSFQQSSGGNQYSDLNSGNQTMSAQMSTPQTQTQSFSSPTPISVNLPVPVGNPQWQESLSQQISLFSRQDIQKAEIRLNPEELGSLHLKLEMNEGKMQLHVIAAQSFVKGVVESAVPHLRVSLAEQGIELQDVDVSDSAMQNHSEQQSMFKQRQNTKDESLTSTMLDKEINTENEVLQTVQVKPGVSVFA